MLELCAWFAFFAFSNLRHPLSAGAEPTKAWVWPSEGGIWGCGREQRLIPSLHPTASCRPELSQDSPLTSPPMLGVLVHCLFTVPFEVDQSCSFIQKTLTHNACMGFSFLFFFFFFFLVLFGISWAAPVAYGGSQARGLIRAVAAGLRQSHSSVGSEPHLRPTPQLMATPDP